MHFSKTNRQTIQPLLSVYLESLSSPIDSYLEGHILESAFYQIEADGQLIGYTAVHQDSMLTQYFLLDAYKDQGQEIFLQVKKLAEVQKAMVPTCDEFFLSHALETSRSIEVQAYFFQDSKKPSEPLPGFGINLAGKADIPFILEKSGDFFGELDRQIDALEIFIGSLNGEKVSFGVVEMSKLLTNYASIGMFVLEDVRQKGIGTTTLLKLKEYVYNEGRKPIAGCWYYNHNSKKTLEKAGMVSQTRMLNISF